MSDDLLRTDPLKMSGDPPGDKNTAPSFLLREESRSAEATGDQRYEEYKKYSADMDAAFALSKSESANNVNYNGTDTETPQETSPGLGFKSRLQGPGTTYGKKAKSNILREDGEFCLKKEQANSSILNLALVPAVFSDSCLKTAHPQDLLEDVWEEDDELMDEGTVSYAVTRVSDNSTVDRQLITSATVTTQSVQLDASTNNEITVIQLDELRGLGFPDGLAMEVASAKADYPIRFWLVDNSGSMLQSDSLQLRHTGGDENGGTVVLVSCTRWTELQGTVNYHAELAGIMQVETVFRMLNDPGAAVGLQELSVADPSCFTSVEDDVKQLVEAVHLSTPMGATPLTPHLLEFRRRIEGLGGQLHRNGQNVIVVIATDGLPTDENGQESDHAKEEFVEALMSLHNLPVFIVIRLCTDDKAVAAYYKNLDKNLKLQVIDHFFTEAKEVDVHNPWLNYAMPLHRCREMGYHHDIFDLLCKRPLKKDELVDFLILLFGKDVMANAPDIHTQWPEFRSFLLTIVGDHWISLSKRKENWIDMRRLSKMYGSGGRGLLSSLSTIFSRKKGKSEKNFTTSSSV